MWRTRPDSGNPQNKNAGNAGDIVKHTVYLALLKHLLKQPPWSERLQVRECHAGRGMYCIPRDDQRTKLLRQLCAPIDADNGVPLHDQQRTAQRTLRTWPKESPGLGWYAGSAVMNTLQLAAGPGHHLMELYEWAPDTRRVLREVLADLRPHTPGVEIHVPPDTDDLRLFDGEQFIADQIGHWDSRDLVFLDPFAMWRQPCHQAQRDRYGQIVDAVCELNQESPLLVLFWTWGRAFPAADGDLNDSNHRIRNGYQDLRCRLHKAGRHFIRILWRWQLQFAMWVLVPDSQQRELVNALRQHCSNVRAHLGDLRLYPEVEVAIDG